MLDRAASRPGNLAWGLIDAIMYLMGCLTERAAEGERRSGTVRRAATPEEGRRAIADAIPPVVRSSLLTAGSLERVRHHLVGMAEPPKRTRTSWSRWR